MKVLNLEELIDKLQSKAVVVIKSETQFHKTKLVQFWNFLEGQPRVLQILDRIEVDYETIGKNIPDLKKTDNNSDIKKILENLDTSEKQGAFGYFIIKQVKEFDSWYDPYQVSMKFFESGTDYEDCKDHFNDFIFTPFIDLLVEILEEFESDNLKDYFSRKEILQTEDKIEEIIEELERQSLGQEVIYEELQDLKEQLGNLTKKNFFQLLKGKLLDIGMTKGTTIAVKTIFKLMTGEDFKLLD